MSRSIINRSGVSVVRQAHIERYAQDERDRLAGQHEIRRSIRRALQQGRTLAGIAQMRGESAKELRAFLAGRSGGRDGEPT
jgi:hypothetical protein